MDFSDYQRKALRTSPKNSNQDYHLVHAGMGLCTEAGEYMDVLKKHVYYDKPFNSVELAEELGDILWYVAIAADALGISMEEIADKNIRKLQARYKGEGFSRDEALQRDLELENKELKN